MGVNVSRLRFFSLLLASLMTAACVSSLGIIGFVGIICPHVAKRLLGQDHRVSIPASALLGSLLLLCADALSRSLGSGSALPGRRDHVAARRAVLPYDHLFAEGARPMLELENVVFRYSRRAEPGVRAFHSRSTTARSGSFSAKTARVKRRFFSAFSALPRRRAARSASTARTF